jgi:hypothetical protein
LTGTGAALVGERAQDLEAAQVRAQQDAAAPGLDVLRDVLQAAHPDVVAVEPAGEQEDAVEDGGAEGEDVAPQVRGAGRAAERPRQVGARGRPRAAGEQEEVGDHRVLQRPADAPA